MNLMDVMPMTAVTTCLVMHTHEHNRICCAIVTRPVHYITICTADVHRMSITHIQYTICDKCVWAAVYYWVSQVNHAQDISVFVQSSNKHVCSVL
jgi:hypothetical protein